jgi:integrase
MQLRVRNGKGAKGRVLPLSERLLQELENYWRAQRQRKAGHDIPWLFLGKKAGEPMVRYTGQSIYYSALNRAVCDARAASIFCATIPSSGLSRVSAPNSLFTALGQHPCAD